MWRWLVVLSGNGRRNDDLSDRMVSMGWFSQDIHGVLDPARLLVIGIWWDWVGLLSEDTSAT